MSGFTDAEVLVAKKVGAIKDPVAECRRRWRNFAFTVGPDGSNLQVQALWTRGGHRCGFKKLLLPDARPAEIERAKRQIAVAALVAAEHDSAATKDPTR